MTLGAYPVPPAGAAALQGEALALPDSNLRAGC